MTCHFCSAAAKKFGTYGPKKLQRYRCLHCGKTFTAVERMDAMHTSVEDAVKVLSLLCEGVGINAASRLTGLNKETVLKVLVQEGEKCAKLMDERLRDLAIDDVQCDEIWTFVGKKQARLKVEDDENAVGDFYTFVAIGRENKLVISSLVGKQQCAVRQFVHGGLEHQDYRRRSNQHRQFRCVSSSRASGIWAM